MAKAIIGRDCRPVLLVDHHAQTNAITRIELAEKLLPAGLAADACGVDKNCPAKRFLVLLEWKSPFGFGVDQAFAPKPALRIRPTRAPKHIPSDAGQIHVGKLAGYQKVADSPKCDQVPFSVLA